MSAYKAVIVGATGANDKDAALIEDIMRQDIFHSTLDWQTKAQLVKAAKTAKKVLAELRADEPDWGK